MGGCSSKWKPWRRSAKVGNINCHEKIMAPMSFDDLVEAVVRAPLKDFQTLRKEWAATRIQAAFRVFLARRALRALKGVVKLQAMFRGQRVRSQTLTTFRCMESLVRAQKRIRVQRAGMDAEARKKMADSKAAKNSLDRSVSSKPSETEHPKLGARSCSDPGRLKEKNFRGWLASASSEIGCSSISASSSSSSSSMSSSLQSGSEGTEEGRYQLIKEKPKSEYSQRLKRLFREIRHDLDSRRNADSLDWLVEGSAEGS